MCINSHNFGINNTKSYAFLFKDGYDCPLLWRAPKNKAAFHFLRQAQFFFGEADFFSAKRLFLRAARDVSGVRSNPPWAREGKTENSFSGFIPLVVPRKGFSPHIPAPRLFVHFHTSKPHHSTPSPPFHPKPTIPTSIPRSLTKSKQPLSKIAVNERAAVW